MRAVDAAGDPIFQHEALEVGRITPKVDGGGLYDDLGDCFSIDSKVKMTAAAGMNLPNNPVAIKGRSCL